MRLSMAARNGVVDNVVDRLDAGGAGTIKIYTGTQPTDPDAALSGNTLLATFTLSATAFTASSAASATLNGLPLSTTAVATGTATWWRAASGGATNILDGTVGAGSGELSLNIVAITSGVTVEITTGVFAQPQGT